MELVRERELRETLERQLSMEQKNRGHQSSAAPPHTESVTQDVDGSNHDDNRLDTKATVQEGRVFLQTTGMY
ncbi:hypothetical protein E3U43_010033 [Larimichthys crocea]|uniref:Uncharacterized protein n=1 Tax=Larimichthys crocea TaxID=215358 RepID=A0ACD3QDX0_LARCR|nr:hypothetical protein E3U43_010033 [Larimichthys crocea]